MGYPKNLIYENNPEINTEKHWLKLTDKQRRILYKRVVLKSKERPTI